MAFQGHATWTPLETGDGDLGTTYRPVDLEEDTSYYGHGGDHSRKPSSSQLSPYQDAYEMNDMSEYDCLPRFQFTMNVNLTFSLHCRQRSNVSFSAPLLSAKDPSIQKGSREPSIRDSIFTKSSRFRRQFSGWKVGVVVCATTAIVVCLLNVILTIWAATSHKSSGGLSYLYTGSCSEVATMGLWIHLAINAMSTLLLSASNCMSQIPHPLFRRHWLTNFRYNAGYKQSNSERGGYCSSERTVA